VLDLKAPDATTVAHRLLQTHDVVVENYRPGVLNKLGLGYDELRGSSLGSSMPRPQDSIPRAR
jgi:crotonobetainyl-CoA:carnitine CoA-transferase CaiB-like acyl-CoA transferase